MTWLRIAGLISGTLISTGPLAGCKQSVQIAIYKGLEELAVSLVQAFFEAITPTTSGSTAAAVVDTIQRWLV
jgi:hypothetical protein